MQPFKIFGLVCVLGTAFSPAGLAGEKPLATRRAYLYQREARTALSRHHWRIAQDKPGRLVASRAERPVGPIPFFKVAALTFVFRPDSTGHTTCTANIVYDTYEQVRGGAQKFNGPLPYDTPENKKEIRGMLAEAERQLITAHPEYNPHPF